MSIKAISNESDSLTESDKGVYDRQLNLSTKWFREIWVSQLIHAERIHLCLFLLKEVGLNGINILTVS